jgi:hypothetical protein
MYKNETTKKTISKSYVPTNEHGFRMKTERVDKSLFQVGLDFRPRNSAYLSEEERFNQLMSVVEKNAKQDHVYLAAATDYMFEKIGLRLVPATICAKLVAATVKMEIDKSIGFIPIDHIKNYIRILVNDGFTRPDIFAHFIIYYQYLTSNKARPNKKYQGQYGKSGWCYEIFPDWVVEILRKKFESLSAHTLKARKMLRRKLKTKHLVIGLKPKPKNTEMSTLYKDIIENRRSSKLNVSISEDDLGNKTIENADHVVAALSSNEISEEEKIKFVSKNIESMPINALIRNLSKINSREDANRVFKKLDKFFKKGYTKIINPFDLLFYPIASDGFKKIHYPNINDYVREKCGDILEKYCLVNINTEKVLIMLDLSGSTFWLDYDQKRQEIINELGWLSFFKKIIQNNRGVVCGFDTKSSEITEMIKKYIHLSPPEFIKRILENEIHQLKRNFNGGTSISNTTEECIKKYNPDSLIIITDEQYNHDFKMLDLKKYDLAGRTILINVMITADKKLGKVKTAFDSMDVLKMYGNSGQVLLSEQFDLMFDFDSFKKRVKSNFIEKMKRYNETNHHQRIKQYDDYDYHYHQKRGKDLIRR